MEHNESRPWHLRDLLYLTVACAVFGPVAGKPIPWPTSLLLAVVLYRTIYRPRRSEPEPPDGAQDIPEQAPSPDEDTPIVAPRQTGGQARWVFWSCLAVMMTVPGLFMGERVVFAYLEDEVGLGALLLWTGILVAYTLSLMRFCWGQIRRTQ